MTDEEIQQEADRIAAHFERADERRWYRRHEPELRARGAERIRQIKAELAAKREAKEQRA